MSLPRIFFLSLALAFSATSVYAETKPVTALAMHGVPKYLNDFTHFDYANINAPKKGTLKLGLTGTFDSLNPFIIRGQPAMGLTTGFLSLIYEPLMARSWDEPFTLYGLIAESVEVAADRSSIIFNLNSKAHWSDGQPLTADDVLFSYQILRDHGHLNHRTYYKKVEKAEKLSDHRVLFTFKRNPDHAVDREMPLIMALMPILPQHDWQGRDFNQTSLRFPIGSGPYKVTKLDPGRSITYTRDDAYWGLDLPSQKGLYNFDEIRMDYYRDDGIALQAFKSGQYDLRRENDPNKWITSYDFPAAKDGRVILEKLQHHRTEPTIGFIFNTRRSPLNDPILRAALEYTFDFEWINRNLFHGQYHRCTSFFPNSELAAQRLPDEKELALLRPYKSQLSSEILTLPVTPPETDGSEDSLRENLLKARDMLSKAGYILHDNKLYAPGESQPISFEILLSDPMQEKIVLTWLRTLKQIGITAIVHTIDSAQFQARMATFNYDVVINKWFNSLSPGNEQLVYWGSAAADQNGSRNYAGIKDPVVDALANAITAATTREDLITATHALDRVLMAGHYMIPFYYLGTDNIASWAERIQHPSFMPLYGMVLESWWAQ